MALSSKERKEGLLYYEDTKTKREQGEALDKAWYLNNHVTNIGKTGIDAVDELLNQIQRSTEMIQEIISNYDNGKNK